MAKEKKEQTVVATPENIMELIENGNRADVTESSKVKELLAKEKSDEKVRLMKDRFRKAEYQRDLALIQRRRERRADDVALYKIRQSGRLCRFLMGFTFDESILEYAKTQDEIWERETLDNEKKTLTLVVDKKKGTKKTFKLGDEVPAIIDVVDYDTMLGELNEKVRSKNSQNEKEYQVEVNKLDLSYGDYYHPTWRW